MILYIANRDINNFMQGADLRPEYKWYVQTYEVNAADPSPEKIRNMIELSKKDKKHWIPAVSCGGKFYCDPSVQILSDGDNEMFILELGTE